MRLTTLFFFKKNVYLLILVQGWSCQGTLWNSEGSLIESGICFYYVVPEHLHQLRLPEVSYYT